MTVKEKLKKIIEGNDSLLGKVFDLFIQGLIILSIISFSLETLPDIDPKLKKHLDILEIVTVIIFTMEYLLRIFVAKRKLKFVFSFFGIIDFLAIFPFYLALGVDFRTIRAIRLLRLFRVFKVFRYTKAIKHFRDAFKSVREELVLFLVAACILLYFASVGIYYFENAVQPEEFSSIFDGLWWAVATLTTVGYGDVYPITTGGKIFTFIILLVGLGIVAVPTGIIASALSKTVNK